jgi:hypothetical protein
MGRGSLKNFAQISKMWEVIGLVKTDLNSDILAVNIA